MGIQVTDSYQCEKRSIGLKTNSRLTLSNAENKFAKCLSFATGLSLENYRINDCLAQMKQFFMESEGKHSLAI